jgi:FtsP/CotA-like multicopper oxidase with cupredoxin domain
MRQPRNPPYNGPTVFGLPNAQGYLTPSSNVNGAIKCQQISGGDGYSTMADGTQIYMFSFGPLSGLADIAAGLPGTQFPNVFNTAYPGTLTRGDPATSDGALNGGSPPSLGLPPKALFTWNGAVGLATEVVNTVNISDLVQGPIPAPASAPGCPTPAAASTVTAYTYEPLGQPVGSPVVIAGLLATNSTVTAPFLGYNGTYIITCVANNVVAPSGFSQFAFQYTDPTAGLAVQSLLEGVTASTPPQYDGHVDPRQIIDIGVMNGNIPAPLFAFDEDDEFFLTLTNVGMIMRPDLFEQHTVHFHGYPNASAFYDGVPDASVAINIGGSFTYYYLAPDAGSYFWHCHITPPEHLQMGMVGQLYVRPRQDRVPSGGNLYTYLGYQNGIGTATPDLRTACNPAADILCSASMPATNTGALQGLDKLGNTQKYVYNDGDGSTAYDVEYPLQMHGFDPNFHFVGMTFNPEGFVDMKDKYFLLNGRSYPDTVSAGPQATVSSDGQMHYSQPLPSIINIPAGGKASLRLVNLSVSEYHTIQTLGVPMKVVGWNAKLLRDQAGMNTEYYANSITLGGGESCDVLLDATSTPVGTYYLFTPMLDHLANDLENFGGLMTEVHVCNSVTGSSTFGNTCK